MNNSGLLSVFTLVKATCNQAFLVTFVISLFPLLYINELVVSNLILPLSLSLGYGLAFLINDFYDQKDDVVNTENNSTNLFSNTNISPELFRIYITVMLIVSLLGFLFYGILGFIFYIISIIIAITYSKKPIRFKTRPVFDLLVHGIFVETYPLIVIIYLINIQFDLFLTLAVLFLFYNSLINQLEQQVRDFDKDFKVINNFTQRFGKNLSKLLISIFSILVILFVLLSLTIEYLTGSAYFITIIPVFIVRILYPEYREKYDTIFKTILYLIIFSFILTYTHKLTNWSFSKW